MAPEPAGPVEPLAAPPTFSVVIAAYQAEETVAAAVESALAQTRAPQEVIVVDDGSTDGTAAALAPYEGRITVIRKENGGEASARNAALAEAGGDFIAFLDADDRFRPGRLEALTRLAMQRPDLDLLATDMTFVVDGTPTRTFLEGNEFETADQRTAILRSCFVGGMPAARASRLREIGGFTETLRIASDWDCWLRLILDGSRAGMVADSHYEYFLHPGALTAHRLGNLRGRVQLLERAGGNPSLRDRERPVLRQELRRRRSDVVEEEAASAAISRRTGAASLRRPLDRHATVVAAAAILSPGLARRLARSRRPPAQRFVEGQG